ncbi:MAG: hypothetical protein CMJ18_08100 [Phycisphaeraceae bacterium]|nr:hypothetical protein [Phycisphaeraceae bacterium]
MPKHVELRRDHVCLADGRPVFPIIARHMPIGADEAMLRDVGFNAIRWTPFGMDACEQDAPPVPEDFGGLMFATYVFNRAELSGPDDPRARELTAIVEAVRNHPDLLCYEQRNEPAYTHREPARAQASPEGMARGSALIRSLDPSHPIRVGHMCCNLVSTLRRYNAAVDVVGCNPYMVMAPGMRSFVGTRADGLLADCPDQTIAAVGRYTQKMTRVAEGRPVWMQVQGAANENWFSPEHTPENRDLGLYEHHRLYPSLWQMRFMAFDAIINGATGLEWMLYRIPIDASAWLDVRRVIGELAGLHDVLAAPCRNEPLEVSYTEFGFSDWDGVQTIVKQHDGQPWIFAANSQFDPMIATFDNLPDGLGGKVRVRGEDREVAIENGTLTDRFQPYEVHVYGPA